MNYDEKANLMKHEWIGKVDKWHPLRWSMHSDHVHAQYLKYYPDLATEPVVSISKDVQYDADALMEAWETWTENQKAKQGTVPAPSWPELMTHLDINTDFDKKTQRFTQGLMLHACLTQAIRSLRVVLNTLTKDKKPNDDHGSVIQTYMSDRFYQAVMNGESRTTREVALYILFHEYQAMMKSRETLWEDVHKCYPEDVPETYDSDSEEREHELPHESCKTHTAIGKRGTDYLADCSTRRLFSYLLDAYGISKAYREDTMDLPNFLNQKWLPKAIREHDLYRKMDTHREATTTDMDDWIERYLSSSSKEEGKHKEKEKTKKEESAHGKNKVKEETKPKEKKNKEEPKENGTPKKREPSVTPVVKTKPIATASPVKRTKKPIGETVAAPEQGPVSPDLQRLFEMIQAGNLTEWSTAFKQWLTTHDEALIAQHGNRWKHVADRLASMESNPFYWLDDSLIAVSDLDEAVDVLFWFEDDPLRAFHQFCDTYGFICDEEGRTLQHTKKAFRRNKPENSVCLAPVKKGVKRSLEADLESVVEPHSKRQKLD